MQVSLACVILVNKGGRRATRVPYHSLIWPATFSQCGMACCASFCVAVMMPFQTRCFSASIPCTCSASAEGMENKNEL